MLLLGVVVRLQEIGLQKQSSQQWILFSGSTLNEQLCERVKRRERGSERGKKPRQGLGWDGEKHVKLFNSYDHN